MLGLGWCRVPWAATTADPVFLSCRREKARMDQWNQNNRIMILILRLGTYRITTVPNPRRQDLRATAKWPPLTVDLHRRAGRRRPWIIAAMWEVRPSRRRYALAHRGRRWEERGSAAIEDHLYWPWFACTVQVGDAVVMRSRLISEHTLEETLPWGHSTVARPPNGGYASRWGAPYGATGPVLLLTLGRSPGGNLSLLDLDVELGSVATRVRIKESEEEKNGIWVLGFHDQAPCPFCSAGIDGQPTNHHERPLSPAAHYGARQSRPRPTTWPVAWGEWSRTQRRPWSILPS
jgi:hypothetical protein